MADTFPAFHVTGPVHHWIRLPGGVPLFLGTCESQPQIEFQETYKPVMNDLTGPNLPAQQVETGQTATLGIALNRFSYGTLRQMNAVIAPGTRGRSSRGLLTFGRTTIEMWQVFDNALVPAVRAAYPYLPAGWYWPQLQLMKDTPAQLGNGKDVIRALAFQAFPYVNPDRSWTLYSEEDGAFPADVLIPQ